LLNKFLGDLTTPLTAETFFQKWNQLGGPPRELQQIVKSKEEVDPAMLKSKVRG
jgi:AP-2 complex subunit alpha